jgi:drug/metabolite transporter (DMT)-like permease
MILGEVSALMAAMSYSYSSNVYSFSVKQSTPILINLQRGLISGTLMLITLLLLGDSIFPQNSLENYLILIFSGIFGIGIGDCFYFKAIDLLGARKTLLLQTMAPLFTGIISYLYFGTTLSLE